MKIKKRFFGVLFAVPILCIWAGVSCIRTEIPLPEVVNAGANEQKPDDTMITPIFTKTDQLWSTTEVKIAEGVSHLSFGDRDRGWALARNSIYSTVDGGATWSLVNMNLAILRQEDRVEYFEFNSDGFGRIILQHSDSDEFSPRDEVRVFQSADSGKTWNQVASKRSAMYSAFAVHGSTSWLVGTVSGPIHPSRRMPFILRWSSFEKKAEDVSRQFSTFLNPKKDENFNYPSISKIAVASSGCVVMASEENSVFQTCDSGESWKRIRSEGDPAYPDLINDLAVIGDEVRILQASGGAEGTGSMLSVVGLYSEKTEKSVSMSSYFLTRAKWVSDAEIIVAGEKKGNPLRDSPEQEKQDMDVILRTLDGGKTWSEVFSRKHDEIRGTFVFADNKTLWLIDEAGRVFKISAPKGN